MATDPNIEQVRILNSENNTYYYLYVFKDRLHSFQQFVIVERRSEHKSSPMPGISWNAYQGLDMIFSLRPKKFPVQDILLWLTSKIDSPNVTTDEIEYALEHFSVPPQPEDA